MFARMLLSLAGNSDSYGCAQDFNCQQRVPSQMPCFVGRPHLHTAWLPNCQPLQLDRIQRSACANPSKWRAEGFRPVQGLRHDKRLQSPRKRAMPPWSGSAKSRLPVRAHVEGQTAQTTQTVQFYDELGNSERARRRWG